MIKVDITARRIESVYEVSVDLEWYNPSFESDELIALIDSLSI